MGHGSWGWLGHFGLVISVSGLDAARSSLELVRTCACACLKQTLNSNPQLNLDIQGFFMLLYQFLCFQRWYNIVAHEFANSLSIVVEWEKPLMDLSNFYS